MISKERQGDFFILSYAIIWGLFPIITILSYHSISPLLSLSISSLFAAIFFAVLITIKKSWYELSESSTYKNILLYTVINGIIYYLLMFFALKFTSAGNVAIVQLTEIGFSFFFFHIIKKDHLPRNHLFGAFFMVIGAIIVLLPNFTAFKLGDLFVIIASAIGPIGSFFVQKARKKVGSEMIMFVRTGLSSIVIFTIALFINTSISASGIKTSLFFLIINGFFSIGLVRMLWIEGIHRISVPKATAFASVAPFFTLLFAWIFLKQEATLWQLFSLMPICIGIFLLSKNQTNAQSVIAKN